MKMEGGRAERGGKVEGMGDNGVGGCRGCYVGGGERMKVRHERCGLTRIQVIKVLLYYNF